MSIKISMVDAIISSSITITRARDIKSGRARTRYSKNNNVIISSLLLLFIIIIFHSTVKVNRYPFDFNGFFDRLLVLLLELMSLNCKIAPTIPAPIPFWTWLLRSLFNNGQNEEEYTRIYTWRPN
jgi:hypothetical protein